MDRKAPDNLDTLVAAIWGDETAILPAERDSEVRAAQNRALSTAIRAYLQSYLDDCPPAPGNPGGRDARRAAPN